MHIYVEYKNKSYKEYNHFRIEEYEKLEDIITIDCSSNELISLPENIVKLNELDDLDFSNNRFTSLSKDIQF